MNARSSDEEKEAKGGWGPISIGSTVRNYSIEKLLSDDIYARLYQVRNEDGAVFTAKIVHPDLKEILKKDFDIISTLKYKYLVNIIECFEYENRLVIISEKVKGMDIRSKVGKLKKTEVITSLEIAFKIADVFSYLYNNGMGHADLYPEHIILTEYEDIKILDPLSIPPKLLKAAVLKGGAARIAYYPPETLNNTEPSGKEVFYFFGAVLYLLLTGEDPYTGISPYKILSMKSSEETALPPRIKKKIDKELGDIISRCMNADPAGRFESFDEIKNILVRSINKHKVKNISADRSYKDLLIKTAAVLAGAVICLALLFLVFSGNKKPGDISAVIQIEARRTDPWGNIIPFRMTDGTTVYSNDGFRFFIDSEDEVYFALISIAPGGKCRTLTSGKDGSVFIHLKKKIKQPVPAEKKWFRFDETAGEEIIYLVLCIKKWQAVDDIMKEKPLSEAADKDMVLRIMSVLDDKLSPIETDGEEEGIADRINKKENYFQFAMYGGEASVYKIKVSHK